MNSAGPESTTDATATLAAYVLALDPASLPPGVVAQARIVLADTLGVLLAASRRSSVGAALRAFPLANGRCTVIGHGRGASPEVAALINGIGGHDIELDDFHSASRTHPGAVIVPAALAAAELRPESTYGELLAGIIAAYDGLARVCYAIGVEAQYERGFHPSAVCGCIGAALCAGRILGLSLDEMRSCIGLAAGQSSGLLTPLDDPSHMAKSFQTGVAARNGVTAAVMAGHGYRAAPDVLSGRHDMLRPFGGDGADASKLLIGLGEQYEICNTTLKRHACCALSHAAVDAVLSIVRDEGLSFDAIERIDAELPHEAVPRIDRNMLWTHNLQYSVAVAAHEGRIGLDHYSSDWTGNPEITALASRATVRGNDELQARFPEQSGAIVTLRAGGRDFVRSVDGPRGSPGEPLSTGELRDKFLHLAGAVLAPEPAASLWDLIATADLDHGMQPLFEGLATSQ